jgi:predicted Zn finger-like uncharacterized protein
LTVSAGIPTGSAGRATAGGDDDVVHAPARRARRGKSSAKRLIVHEIVFATAALLSSPRSGFEASVIIIECPNCHARYQYDEERFERKPAKRIKCAKCATIFEIKNPAYVTAAPAVVGEQTLSRREGPKVRKEETTEQSPLPERSTDKMQPELQLPEGKRISLAVINGPDAGSVFRIEKPRVTIGRANADLTLNDTEASRVHAAIEVRDVGILLRDLGSTNGTLVDGQKIGDAVELQDKSEFQVGATTLMLIVTEDA